MTDATHDELRALTSAQRKALLDVSGDERLYLTRPRHSRAVPALYRKGLVSKPFGKPAVALLTPHGKALRAHLETPDAD